MSNDTWSHRSPTNIIDIIRKGEASYEAWFSFIYSCGAVALAIWGGPWDLISENAFGLGDPDGLRAPARSH